MKDLPFEVMLACTRQKCKCFIELDEPVLEQYLGEQLKLAYPPVQPGNVTAAIVPADNTTNVKAVADQIVSAPDTVLVPAAASTPESILDTNTSISE